MQYKILLSYNENLKKIVEEEKYKFLRSTLEAVGVPIDFWNSNQPFDRSIMIDLKKVLDQYDLTVIDEEDMKIYSDSVLIGEFKKPLYVMVKNPGSIDPKNKVYIEMTVDFFSIFEEEEPAT